MSYKIIHKNKRCWYNSKKSVNNVLRVLITNEKHLENGRFKQKIMIEFS